MIKSYKTHLGVLLNVLFFKLESFSAQNIKWKKELPLCVYIYIELQQIINTALEISETPWSKKETRLWKRLKKYKKKKKIESVMSQH